MLIWHTFHYNLIWRIKENCMHVFSPNFCALTRLLSLPLNNRPFYEKLRVTWYALQIGASWLDKPKFSCKLFRIATAPSHLSFSPLLHGIPLFSSSPTSSNLLPSFKMQTDLILHVASFPTHNALGAATGFRCGRQYLCRGLLSSSLQATDWLAPPADSHCCGSIWTWSPWQQQQAWPHLLSLSPHTHNLSPSLSYRRLYPSYSPSPFKLFFSLHDWVHFLSAWPELCVRCHVCCSACVTVVMMTQWDGWTWSTDLFPRTFRVKLRTGNQPF